MTVFEIASPSVRENTWATILGPLFSLIINVIAGWFLIAKANKISDKLGPVKDRVINVSLTKTDFVELAIVVIGFIAILYGVPVILQKLVSYAYFNPYEEREERRFFWDNRDTSAMIYYGFQSVGGLFVLLNARYLARKLEKVSESVISDQ